MSSLRFFQVDVFARARFGGNPLAVFIGADGVETGLMQQIAREMNLSETTFVQTPKQREHAALVRIFTPGQELPFAGHPTVGTAFVLTRLGLVNAPQFTFEEGVGPVGLRRGDEPDFFWMQPPLPPVDATFDDTAGIAAALGLSAADIAAPARSIGAGLLNVLCVALRSKSAVDDLRIDREKLVTPTSEKAAFGDLLIFHYASG
ncbi:MAG: PhzF family phenazine biosynthesis protein, partial [Candidatus Eremiobacteraeota bacterium]|nr:PhzF family phenazine biosynthesis protein [Candidatus Eremiobacteraeota bacterium]